MRTVYDLKYPFQKIQSENFEINRDVYIFLANKLKNKHDLQRLTQELQNEKNSEEQQHQILNGILSNMPENDWLVDVNANSSPILAAALTSYKNKANSKPPENAAESTASSLWLTAVLTLLVSINFATIPVLSVAALMVATSSLTNYFLLPNYAEKKLTGLSCKVIMGSIPQANFLPETLYLQHSHDHNYDYAYLIDGKKVYGQVTLSPNEVPSTDTTFSFANNNSLLQKTGYRNAMKDMHLDTLQAMWMVGALAGTALAYLTLMTFVFAVSLTVAALPISASLITLFSIMTCIALTFPTVGGLIATNINTNKAVDTHQYEAKASTYSRLGEKNSSSLFPVGKTTNQEDNLNDTSYSL